MIRRDKNAIQKRQDKKLVGFTKEEWETICKKAKAAGMRNGTYIKVMAVKGKIKYYDLKETGAMKRSFLSIGNNLNRAPIQGQ